MRSEDSIILQASKNYPQLAEHAARMKCQPSTEFGQFLRGVMQRETASNYDNVIATSNWVEEEEEKPAKVLLTHSCMGLSQEGEETNQILLPNKFGDEYTFLRHLKLLQMTDQLDNDMPSA